ncbi:hypothetical protein ACP4OV_030188 [Aristida adscensionis]
MLDNLLKDPTEASQAVLENAFTRSQKGRALTSSNLLFFPLCFEKHWFLFVVDIKDQYFVFLDSYYTKDCDYQKHVRERFILSRITRIFMSKGLENRVDGGICVMVCMQHWNSPRTILSNIFGRFDIPRIRVKIANELMFRYVLEFADNDCDDE